MTYLGRSLRGTAIPLLVLALAACGSKPDTTGVAAAVDSGSQAAAGEDPDEGGTAGGSAAGGVTAVDAARGSGGTLPAVSYGPSAYDLAQVRLDRTQDRPARVVDDSASQPVQAQDTGGAGGAADRPRSSEGVGSVPAEASRSDPARP
ncbi:MAG: hypothetical protein JWL91_2803 [Sphingomonas bacterium]|nr:hypothetical protein [Sphingomonas bacterium]